MTSQDPPPRRGTEHEEQTIWLASGALRPRGRSRATGWIAGAAALAFAAGVGGGAWLYLGLERDAALAPAVSGPAPSVSAPADSPAPEAAAPAPAPAPADVPRAERADASVRLFCPIVGDDGGGGASYGAGFVREPVEEDELPAIVLGSAVWRCLDGRDDPAHAALPALAFAVRLGPDLASPATPLAGAFAPAEAAPAQAAPPEAPDGAAERQAEDAASGPAPLAMTLSRDADDPRALRVEAPLEELAARFQTQPLSMVAAEFRLANGAPLIRTSRVSLSEGGAARLFFGELPSPATLSRLFWFDLKLIDADGREYALTLQMGRDARILLAAVIEIDA